LLPWPRFWAEVIDADFWGEARAARKAATMFTKVREGSRYGACSVLGELVEETETRYFYRRRFGNALASFVEKRLPSIHIAPCKVCADYHERKEAALDATSFAGEQESQARKLSRKRSLGAASG
jgi:hypothetical protein